MLLTCFFPVQHLFTCHFFPVHGSLSSIPEIVKPVS